MRTPIALLLGLAVASSAAGATFTSQELGLTFQHPDNWKITKKKGDIQIAVPTSGGSAQLFIFARTYNADIELWQAIEKNIAIQQKQTVDAQTQEEIMGVPLLLTRVKYNLKGEAMMGLAGLVYSATPRKMLFRLTATESTFDEAERQLRGALQTMKTVDGKLPKAEDPNRVVTPDDARKAETPTKITTIRSEVKKTGKAAKAPVAVATKAAGMQVFLCLPKGWSGEAREDGSVVVKGPSLTGSLVVSVLSSLDSPAADKALAKAAADSLDRFTVVKLREDLRAARNSAGAMVSIVWRDGSEVNDKGVLSCDAVGVTGDNYWLVSYVGATPEPAKKDRKALEVLFKAMSVEPAQ